VILDISIRTSQKPLTKNGRFFGLFSNFKNFSDGPIEAVAWGLYRISGKTHGIDSDGNVLGAGKDIILYKDRVIEWNQRRGHCLTKEMLIPVLKLNPDVLIIGNGYEGRLEVPNSLISEIVSERPINIIILKTPEACSLYNKLCGEMKNVVFAGHATC
jgi:hypothetical protein